MEKNEALKQKALDFLRKNVLSVVATVTADSKPNAATVLYYVDDDLNFYFVTRRQTRKFANMSTNRHVAVVVGVGDMPGTIQMEGEAELMEEGLEHFMKQLEQHEQLLQLYFGPFTHIQGLDFAIFKVRIDWFRLESMEKDTLQIEEFSR